MLFPALAGAIGTKFLLALNYVLLVPFFAFIYYFGGRRILWILTGGKLKSVEIESLVDGLGMEWQGLERRDCPGTVEGVFAFFRGKRNPVEWLSFCLVIEPSEGFGQVRLLGAAPRSELPANLRSGGALLWSGHATTGRIHTRPDLRVPIL